MWKLLETSSELGVTVAHVTLLAFCILFHLVSLMHQVHINTFGIRHLLLPEFFFHQLPENFHHMYYMHVIGMLVILELLSIARQQINYNDKQSIHTYIVANISSS